jgi:MFS family permease
MASSPAPSAHTLPLAVCLFLLMLPVTAMVPVLSELTQGRYPGTSDFARHLFMSVNMVGALVAAPLAGLASDSVGRRTPLIAVGFAINGLALLLIGGEWSYPTILALRFLEGAAHMTSLSLLMTLGADHARRVTLGGSMGAVGAAVSLGVATGAPLGGWLGADDALRVPWAGGLAMLAMALVVPLLVRDAGRSGPRRSPRALVQALSRNHRLVIPYVFAFVDRLSVGVIVSTFSLYLGTVMGFAPARIGLTMAAFLVPFSILTWPAGLLCRRWNRFGMMVIGSVLYGCFFVVLGVVPAHALTVVMALGGVVAALMYAPSLVLTAELAGPGQRASTLAGFNVAGSLGFVVGPLVGGTLVGVFRTLGLEPYAMVFVIVGALEIVVALVMVPVWRRSVVPRADSTVVGA